MKQKCTKNIQCSRTRQRIPGIISKSKSKLLRDFGKGGGNATFAIAEWTQGRENTDIATTKAIPYPLIRIFGSCRRFLVRTSRPRNFLL